ncbi:efflux RND transporter periplasmic adaptor subunit [Pseudomonas sp. GD03944]|uniref:efflux RND transporter periplasmic adaptor subunit n=1 Tax=Pseudomonas sp. GD03944 TaxID=2975409 RepID=UPI00244C769D|nr:efflux RND transporter periplasmic adaptor subunit [Pseudomonas sp. GD03944]MDH1265921.1 efflux RND transporter periplasmic adaptor subunit [Pseudomonas sp. GD03944]
MTRFCRYSLALAALLGLAACGGSPSEEPQDDSQAKTSAQRATSVKVEAAQRRELQAWVYSQGTARSRQREFLTFTQQGVVSHVDEELRVGMPVKAGQLIANQAPERVTADLQAARASLAEAQASLKLAEVTEKRYENLIEQRSASRQELDEAQVQVQQARAVRDNARAELAQAQLSVDESRLVSPIDGVLARLNVEKGRYFMPSTVQTDTEQNALRTVPAMVIDPDRFEVRVDLPSYNYRQIADGAKAVIGENVSVGGQDVDPLANRSRVEGQVYAISPSLDPETRTFEVIVHTHGNETGLQDGEFVAVWIAEPAVEDALVVPLEALRFRNDQAFVFVVEEGGDKVSERRVELGQQSGEYRAVTSGLEEGERVVTDGRAALNDGQQVRIIGGAGEAP